VPDATEPAATIDAAKAAASGPPPAHRIGIWLGAYAEAPYRQGRDQTNASDGIFDDSLVLDLSEDGNGILGKISFDVPPV
jgi:hypothetical protein